MSYNPAIKQMKVGNPVIPARPESFFVFREIPDALCLRE
jgi:hypothetical protein